MQVNDSINIDEVFGETFQPVPKKEYDLLKFRVLVLIISFASLLICISLNNTLFALLSFIIFFSVLMIQLKRLDVKSDIPQKVVCYKNGLCVVSKTIVPEKKADSEKFYFSFDTTPLLSRTRLYDQKEVIIFNKNNVQSASLILDDEKQDIIKASRLFKGHFEREFANNHNKIVHITFKQPINYEWNIFFPFFKTINHAYISVDEPEKLIEYLRNKEKQPKNSRHVHKIKRIISKK